MNAPLRLGRVTLVGTVVTETPYGAEVAFTPPAGGHPGAARPVWIARDLFADLGVSDVLPGATRVFLVSATWAAEKGLA